MRGTSATRTRIGRIIGWLAVAYAIGAAVVLAFAPLIPAQVFTLDSAGHQAIENTHASLATVAGPRVVIALLAPALVAVLAMLWRRQVVRWVATGLMAAFVVLTLSSVGWYFAPVAIALLVAAVLAPPDVVDIREEASATATADATSEASASID
ncbi:MAG: hypothetical protein U0R64_04315 [Candidatus Nanopelagicales bacterium]